MKNKQKQELYKELRHTCNSIQRPYGYGFEIYITRAGFLLCCSYGWAILDDWITERYISDKTLSSMSKQEIEDVYKDMLREIKTK